MKKLTAILVSFLITLSMFAQVPQKMSYQAVIRSNGGGLITNTQIGMEINILKGSSTGTIVYTETQTPTTNTNGLVSIQIGGGTGFDTITWSNDTYFIETKTATDGINYDLISVSQLLSVPYALCAEKVSNISNITSAISDSITSVKTYVDNAISNISQTTYSVGDFAHGGIVFWVDGSGQHGLVCAKNDLDIPSTTGRYNWFPGTTPTTVEYTTRAKFPSGKTNTLLIVSAHTAAGEYGNYAASYCLGYQVTENGSTYGDWYLPSKEELNMIYLNKAIIDSTALANGAVEGSSFGTTFNSALYWTSTEYSYLTAYKINMGNGYTGTATKTDAEYIRPVRSF